MEEYLKKYANYKLCYVDSSEYIDEDITLYFTELEDVTEQWGDDWNDRPYEHNAEPPYEEDYRQPELRVENGRGIYPPIDIMKVIVTSTYNISTPCTGVKNSKYTVEEINKGVTPWLTILDENDNATHIKAGTTLKDTLEAIKKARKYAEFYVLVK